MRIGLVLSGGGARGLAHVGVIKALNEHGVKVTAMSGSSAGAIIAVLYSYGYEPDEIMEIFRKTSIRSKLRPALARTGLLNIVKLKSLFEELIPEDDFSALKIPTTIAATDIRHGVTTYFSEGELIMPVLASCCVPVIFRPLNYKDGIYVDGGILDNLPAEPLKDQVDFVIGSHTNPIENEFHMKNVKELIERSLLMAINGNTQQRKAMCDLVIEPPELGKYAGSQVKKAREIFEIGYRYTMENFDNFKIPK